MFARVFDRVGEWVEELVWCVGALIDREDARFRALKAVDPFVLVQAGVDFERSQRLLKASLRKLFGFSVRSEG